MSVEATNRIIDPGLLKARKIKYALKDYYAQKRAKKRRYDRWIQKNIGTSVGICEKCKGAMRKDLANTQLQNKENIIKWHGYAPICQACIMGYKRKNNI